MLKTFATEARRGEGTDLDWGEIVKVQHGQRIRKKRRIEGDAARVSVEGTAREKKRTREGVNSQHKKGVTTCNSFNAADRCKYRGDGRTTEDKAWRKPPPPSSETSCLAVRIENFSKHKRHRL